MRTDIAPVQLQPSRIRSLTIFLVLVMASVSGAAAAQFTSSESPPHSIGQPDAVRANPWPLAFDGT